MQINVFASGSGGNCTMVSSAGTHILIDAGISMRRIKNALGELGLFPKDISGVLVTHEHSDHISGLATMIKYHQLPIYAPRTVGNHLRWSIAGVENFLCEIQVGGDFKIGDMSVTAFSTPHDTPQSVGYRIDSGICFGYCTDLGHVSEEVLEGLTGADAVMIEANHDVDMLLSGSYPYHLKRRILSDRGHLSNECCGQLAAHLARNGASAIVLAHLSQENNRPALAGKTVSEALEREGVRPGQDVTLRIAPQAELVSLKVERICSPCSA
ncbi:MAG TPA: MBL fold metallo-hydrolase [Clostridiales bacterium]|nr:MBL fold metallo-hydrolase [Clostridiales bacterium]